MDVDDPIDVIVRNIYPYIVHHFHYNAYFEDRTILAPTHMVVESINESVLSMIPREKHECFSPDSVCTSNKNIDDDSELYSVAYLNSIKCSRLPNHHLVLKIGVPIMLLWNINQRGWFVQWNKDDHYKTGETHY